ncbi:MAG: hypothetical protein Q8O29_03750 [Polaromonas sp.]|uniref:hypothetical protein n=1 Tax=Polaromonas sp. TaxID=1869339 RepID=UPI002735AAC5|nr:hypothetical protein [Polaromonas sp.]MDP2817390.1 hypothetical protein [Polaromonas sp.]
MKLTKLLPLMLLLPLSGIFHGCTTSSGSVPAASASAPSDGNSKAEKKISMAIGQEVGTFTIAGQQKIDSAGGTDGMQYTVKTKAGKTFKCDILEPSGFGKVMSWGMASGSSAMCTDFTAGSPDQGKTNKASCNALLKAAGKC